MPASPTQKMMDMVDPIRVDPRAALSTSFALADLDTARLDEIGIKLQHQVSLAAQTTIKVGGPADYFAVVRSMEELTELVRWAQTVSLPYLILGGGSNILISDRGVRGLVIHNRCRQVTILAPDGTPFEREKSGTGVAATLIAESGVALAGLARTSIRAGLSGLEWAVSVPGTVGGAVVGNAGAHGSEIKDHLQSALLVDREGRLRTLQNADFSYSYRNSSLKRLRLTDAAFNPVLLQAQFELFSASIKEATALADSFLQHRRRTQPVEPSLGSTFENPADDHAGRLIEAAGLKGARIGGVEVSRQHANFLVNHGGVGAATATDVLGLISHVQQIVHQRMGVWLTPEVQLVGAWHDDEVARLHQF